MHDSSISCKTLWYTYKDEKQLQKEESSWNEQRLRFFLDASLEIEILQGPQSNLEEKKTTLIS